MLVDRDAEYVEYVGARWRALVSSAVLLGCAVSEAEDLVQSTLIKVYVGWDRVRAAEHRDAYVAKMLLNASREKHRRRRWRERRGPPAGDPGTRSDIESRRRRRRSTRAAVVTIRTARGSGTALFHAAQ
jgi:DNA-directed RNA polymerase specialized sigma24 family protein